LLDDERVTQRRVMLYRRSVNKLMHRAILLSLSPRLSPPPESPFPSSGLMSRPVYALKSLILIHPPPWISTIRDLATNRRLFLLDRPRLMIRYAEERVADLVGGRKRGGGWSRKSDRMSTTNLSAILREFFPSSDERRKPSSAITFPYKYANMAARCTALGRVGVRDDSRGERERERERTRD